MIPAYIPSGLCCYGGVPFVVVDGGPFWLLVGVEVFGERGGETVVWERRRGGRAGRGFGSIL